MEESITTVWTVEGFFLIISRIPVEPVRVSGTLGGLILPSIVVGAGPVTSCS